MFNKLKAGSLILLFFCGLVNNPIYAESPAKKTNAQIAIVIDDLGHDMHLGRRAINLGVPVTLSFLPNRIYTRVLAKYAGNKDQELMLHLPMENKSGFPLGELGLTQAMTQENRRETLLKAIAAVPGIVGLNNHLGSVLTRDRTSMDWLMADLLEQGLFFVDSLTVNGSVAWEAAKDAGLPFVKRNVFLDNSLNPVDLDRQFQRALRIAEANGMAVLIVHPYHESLDFLEMRLSLAKSYEAIDFVFVSQIVKTHNGLSFHQWQNQKKLEAGLATGLE